jgi:hypothetical protein
MLIFLSIRLDFGKPNLPLGPKDVGCFWGIDRIVNTIIIIYVQKKSMYKISAIISLAEYIK